MNYEIKDLYHILYIKLNSNINLTGKNIYLQTYINNSSSPHLPVYVPSSTSPLTFKVNHSDFQVGDVITGVRVVLTSTNPIPLYELNEGVSIVVDGAESKVKEVINGSVVLDDDDNPVMVEAVTNPQFAVNFGKEGEHTVQAVYKGNSALGVAFSNKVTLNAEQNTGEDGNYKLEITKLPKTMKYMSDIFWQFKLTKGGLPVGGKTVEKITPLNIWSDTDYNRDGLYEVKSVPLNQYTRWNVGKYKVGARYYHQTDPNSDKSVICSVWQDIEIKKNTPRLTGSQPVAGKKGNAVFYLRYPKLTDVDDEDLGIPKAKLTIKVGGKKYTKTTDSKGAVKLYRNSTKKVTYKVSYAGNKNLNKINKTFS